MELLKAQKIQEEEKREKERIGGTASSEMGVKLEGEVVEPGGGIETKKDI